MRGRPLRHGPHWRALCSARYVAISAVRMSPHSDRLSAWMIPAPGLAPKSFNPDRDNLVPANAHEGIQLP